MGVQGCGYGGAGLWAWVSGYMDRTNTWSWMLVLYEHVCAHCGYLGT